MEIESGNNFQFLLRYVLYTLYKIKTKTHDDYFNSSLSYDELSMDNQEPSMTYLYIT